MLSNYRLSKYVTKVFETPSRDYSEWFGYYNYDTLNDDQTKMLCGRSAMDGVSPVLGMTIELGYYDIPGGVWHHIGDSDSWNWQQGAMLQWLRKDNGQELVIYNCSKEGRLISRIHNIQSGEDLDIDWPIYGIIPGGKKSISLDLERSYWCRAYHYQSVSNPSKDGRVYEDDGIFEIDLINNTKKRIVSIQDIIKTDYRPSFDNKKHWLEHIMINPSGTGFCFLHRFSDPDNVMQYETRLFVSDIEGKRIQCIDGWDKVRWSHFGWCGDNAFAIYSYFPSKIKAPSFKGLISKGGFSLSGLVKFVLLKGLSMFPSRVSRHLGCNYSAYQFYKADEEGTYRLAGLIDPKESGIDGHPSFTNTQDVMITDTYGNKNSKQLLYAYNMKTNDVAVLAEFTDFYKSKPSSCDLHPKLCKNNDYIVVDTAYNEKHHMVVLRIDWAKLFAE